MFTPTHLHLIVKCYVKYPPTREDELNDWFRRLVEKVRMVVVAGPTSVYINDPGNEGLTGTVTLATSHASIHIWDKYEVPMIQFDIYSCSLFSPREVIEHLDEFTITTGEYVFLDRNNSICITEKRKIEDLLAESDTDSWHL